MNLLQQLSLCNAPSGHETCIHDLIRAEVAPYVDEITVDALGNLICHKKGNGKKLMLTAHADEIGVIVTYIDDNGFLRFAPVGGVRAMNCVGRAVHFTNGTAGVISFENKSAPDHLDKFYLDIGAKDRAEAETRVQIGDMACFSGEYLEMGDLISGKAMDDRAGCYALIEAIKRVAESPNDLYLVFTAQEELGLRGAKTAAFAILPDMGIAVDVSNDGGTPESKHRSLTLGKGPSVKLKDGACVMHPAVRELLIGCAKRADVPFQLESADFGGTDAGAIHLTGAGIPSGTISIPTRYVHSPQEVIHRGDLEQTVALLAAVMGEALA